MSKRLIQILKIVVVIFLVVGSWSYTKVTEAQSNPTPAPLNMTGYNYAESNSCTGCHFVMGAKGDHMLEAVGVSYTDATKTFAFTGNGWLASRHAATNYGTTQNTYCAKCHAPLQAAPESSFVNGFMQNTSMIPDGKFEAVTCATCHPTHNSAVTLGRRLGVYQFGKDRNTVEAYKVVHEGEEDALCLNCHVTRHNETNPGFKRMYDAGVKCIDCHMAPYGKILGTEVEKRFHDFKVANNLPFSCGAEGSMTGCHTEFSKEGTLAFLPYFKQQHKEWWPKSTAHTAAPFGTPFALNGFATERGLADRTLSTAQDYYILWRQLDADARARKASGDSEQPR